MMTTIKNKIMKSATSSYRKVACFLLAASMVLSLAACTNGNDNKESNPTAESTISPVPTQPDETKPIESSVTPTEKPSITPSETPTAEPTQEPTSEPTQKPADGKYTYKIYDQFEVTMDVNIDDYILVRDWGTYFDICSFAKDYGWQPSDGVNILTEDSPLYTCPYGFARDNEGVRSIMGLKDVWIGDDYMLDGFSLKYKNRDENVFPSGNHETDYSNLSILIEDKKKEYIISGPNLQTSYDNMVLIVWIMWKDTVNPGINPIWPLFGDWNCTYHVTTEHGTIEYKL